MPTFTPPVVNDVPAVFPNDREQSPWRFFADGPRGVNVWKLTTGAYTEVEPADASTVEILYHGGHIHTVTAGEAALLTAAGYGDRIT